MIPAQQRSSAETGTKSQDNAALYAQTYGREEPVIELIPAMLTAFLESDRAFARARNGGK
jgi:hypothetical protein